MSCREPLFASHRPGAVAKVFCARCTGFHQRNLSISRLQFGLRGDGRLYLRFLRRYPTGSLVGQATGLARISRRGPEEAASHSEDKMAAAWNGLLAGRSREYQEESLSITSFIMSGFPARIRSIHQRWQSWIAKWT